MVPSGVPLPCSRVGAVPHGRSEGTTGWVSGDLGTEAFKKIGFPGTGVTGLAVNTETAGRKC